MDVPLDLPADFDTIDHKILLNRPNKKYCIGETALKWFILTASNTVCPGK